MMDFEKVILGVMNYGNYRMMRNSGSTPVELEYFHGYEEMEKQYQSNVSPDELGMAMIDSQAGVLQ